MECEQGSGRVHTERRDNSRTPRYFSPRVATAGSASQSAGRHLLYRLGVGPGWLVVGSRLLLTSDWIRYRTLRSDRSRRPEYACDRSSKIAIEKNGCRGTQPYGLDSLRPCRHTW